MSIGKVGLNALGRLGNGLGSILPGVSDISPTQLEEAIILEDETGFILIEDNSTIITETVVY